jgi:5-methylcytosine-specific restriction endonuclease McrA
VGFPRSLVIMADSTSYKVIVQGISAGQSLKEVKKRLSGLLKIGPEQIDRLFEKAPVEVKKDLDRASALKLKSILESTGALCGMEITKRWNQPSRSQIKLAGTSTRDSEKTLVCPKCGFKQRPSHTCVRCAITVDKFLKMMEHEEPIEENGEEVPPTEGPANSAYEPLRRFLGTKYGLISAGVMVLFFVAILFEFFYLQGDLVASGSVDIINTEDAFKISVDQSWKEYLVEISTGGRNRKLSFRLEGPEGLVLHEEMEYRSHKGDRNFTFRPPTIGTYTLFVDPGVLTYGGWGYARVRVYVNDRRIFNRIRKFFRF